mmetsp:Transcript_8442/g.14529  ORF Transcript_8442/g.14529 Transcript_8442/m.14529 type:complete len:503 (+) Transcript_8442:523-2031(+)
MGGAAHQVGEDAQHDGGRDGGGAAGNEHGEEGGVHGPDVRGPGGEHVVGVDVDGHHNHERRLPGQPESANQPNDFAGQPSDEPVLVEVVRHRDQRREPRERVPGAALRQTLLPRDDPGDQQRGESDQRSRHGPDPNGATTDPQRDGDEQGGAHDLLVLGHRAQDLQLFLCQQRRLRRLLQLRGVHDVQEQGDQDERQHTRDACREGPLAPRDGVACDGGCQVHRQRVCRHSGDEHGGGDAGGLEHGEHHEGAHLALGALLRVTAARQRQGLGDGEEDATGASGDRGDGGSKKCFREHQAVHETQSGLAESSHDHVGDAVAKSGLDEAAGKEESNGDQPGDFTGESAEGGGEGHDARAHGHTETDHGDGTKGQRHGDDSNDRADENREKLPRLDGDTSWGRDEPQHQTATDGNRQGLHVGSLGRRCRGRSCGCRSRGLRRGRLGLHRGGSAGSNRERGLLKQRPRSPREEEGAGGMLRDTRGDGTEGDGTSRSNAGGGGGGCA